MFMRHKKILDSDTETEPMAAESSSAQSSETAQSQRNHDVSMALGLYTANDMPESLTPKDNTDKDQVFADEIDPSWRDDNT